MAVDIDRLSTWLPHKPSMCRDCMGFCCRLPLEVSVPDLVRMEVITEDEALWSARKIARKLQSQGIITSFRASKMQFMIAQKSNRDCIYLDENRLCKIYEKRPEVCRSFPTCSPRPQFCPSVRKPQRPAR